MVKWLDTVAGIFVSAISIGAVTPNSQLFNDFPLEFDAGWNAYKQNNTEQWSNDSLYNGDVLFKESGIKVNTFSNGKISMMGEYELWNQNWFATQKTVITPIDQGYDEVVYTRDTLKTTWQLIDGISVRFNAEGGCIAWYMDQYDSTGAKTPYVLTVYRNGSNRVDSTVWNVSMQTSGMSVHRIQKSTYSYDGENRYLSRDDTITTTVEGMSMEIPKKIQRSTFSYSTLSGKPFMSIRTDTLGSSSWGGVDSFAVIYDADNQVTDEESYRMEGDSWEKNIKRSYIYNDGKKTTELDYTVTSDNWEKEQMTTYHYSAYTGATLPPLDGSRVITSNMVKKSNHVVRTTLAGFGNYMPAANNVMRFTLNGKQMAAIKKNGSIPRINQLLLYK